LRVNSIPLSDLRRAVSNSRRFCSRRAWRHGFAAMASNPDQPPAWAPSRGIQSPA
jgi:hypothetical protein